MPGVPKGYMNKQHQKAMTAPIKKEADLDLEKRAREAGL